MGIASIRWLLLLSAILSTNSLRFTSKEVPSEYLVMFKGRMSVDAQRHAIGEALGDDAMWELVKGSRPFTGEGSDSDFATIKLRGGEEDTQRLKLSSKVKYVIKEKRIFYHAPAGAEAGVGGEDAGDDDAGRGADSGVDAKVQGDVGASNALATRRQMTASMMMESHVPPPPPREDASSGSKRRLLSISDNYQANRLWDKGYSGQHVKVAIFDTGIDLYHKHFNHVEDRSNWTDEDTLEDRLGHGTFVAGVVAGKDPACHGFAEQAEIHTFRVFTQKQMSFTSWFLDAFNYAIETRMNILNLSIGGPDYRDAPFMDKVREMSANNIIVVSAIGNDGPLWGTLNNPADQQDVIGVGGIDYKGNIAPFSSRGISTGELPDGYGRVKPDIVAYGKDVPGSAMKGGCRTLSGTSVASPVVTGAVTLLASTIDVAKRPRLINPASMKQALVESATRLPKASIFEQGAGNLNVFGAFEILSVYQPRATIFPSEWDITASGCPYFWPFCTQPLYAGAQPIILNSTILNGMNELGKVVGDVRVTSVNGGAGCLKIAVEHSQTVWPWSGHIALILTVDEKCRVNPKTTEEVTLAITVASPPSPGSTGGVQTSTATMKVKADIVPSPEREKRILWDQYHNVQYPSGYFPRDFLGNRDFLDWNGDHPHTNFRSLFARIQQKGYFLEILGHDYTCFDASEYGSLMIVDTEDNFRPEEVSKLEKDVKEKGLSVVILAEWYNEQVMDKIKFFDDNTQLWWSPATGGGNVPALNQLLKPFGAALSDTVWKGDFKVSEGVLGSPLQTLIKSGTSIARWPAQGVIWKNQMQDEGASLMHNKVNTREVPMMGILEAGQGRIGVFGDSSCVDDKESDMACWWAVDSLLKFAATGNRNSGGFDMGRTLPLSKEFVDQQAHEPVLDRKHELHRYSRTESGASNCRADKAISMKPVKEEIPGDVLKGLLKQLWGGMIDSSAVGGGQEAVAARAPSLQRGVAGPTSGGGEGGPTAADSKNGATSAAGSPQKSEGGGGTQDQGAHHEGVQAAFAVPGRRWRKGAKEFPVWGVVGISLLGSVVLAVSWWSFSKRRRKTSNLERFNQARMGALLPV